MRLFSLVAVVVGTSLVASVALAEPKHGHAKPHAKTSAKSDPPPRADPLVVSATLLAPTTDYQAETYAGVPLDGAYAKERGLGKGLVYMVFERQRRPAFRVGHDRITKVVRFVEAAQVNVVLAKSTTATRVDVLDTKDGIVVIEMSTTNAGIFTTSDVYVFPSSATPTQRNSALDRMAPATRERIRAALAIALR